MNRYDDKLGSTLEKEIEFIEFLGYHYEGGKNDGCGIILDNNDKSVGNIYYDDNSYHTIIDSDTIHYDNEGRIAGWNDKIFTYEVKGKGKVSHGLTKDDGKGVKRIFTFNGNIDGNSTSIELEAIPRGTGIFKLVYYYYIHHNYFYVRLEYNYDRGIYEYYTSEYDSEFTYYFKTLPNSYGYNPNKSLRVIEYLNSESRDEDEINETLEELVIKHQRGIEFVDKMRKLIDDIVPHKTCVLDSLFNKEVVDMFHLNAFFPSFDKEKTK